MNRRMGQTIMDEHIKGSDPSSAERTTTQSPYTYIDGERERGRERGIKREREKRERERMGGICRRTPANMRMGR